MKLKATIPIAAGFFLALFLIGTQGFRTVTNAVLAVGWGLLGVTLFHLITIACSSLAWRRLLADKWHQDLRVFIQARWIREGVNDLLPVAQIGGHVAGARILTLHGAKPDVAGASVVVDVTMRMIALLLFTFIGLALFLQEHVHHTVLPWLIGGILWGILALLSFIVAQRCGLLRVLERLFQALAKKWNWPSLGNIENLHESIQVIYHHPVNLLLSGGLHLLSLGVGAIEIWLALSFMGFPVEFQHALLVESLGQAIRTAGFWVPGALGVQEGGYLLLGSLIGLPASVGLAVSLVKRVRDWLLGLPALLAWNVIEYRRQELKISLKNGSLQNRQHF